MYENDSPDYPDMPEETMKIQVEIPIAWSNEEIQRKASEAVVARIYDDIKPTISAAMHDKLDEMVNTAIATVLEHPILEKDYFGKPKGPDESIKQRLERTVEEWLMQGVDQYGRTSSSSYSRDKTRAEHLFWEAVKKSLDSIVKKVITDSVGDLEEVVAKEVKKQIAAFAKKAE